MISIDESNNITVTRGDTLLFTVAITLNGTAYTCNAGDTVRFAMKSAYTDQTCLILKQIPTDTMLLTVPTSEMKEIPANKKGYVYDIQLTTADGVVDTFISGKVYVTEEVE